MSEILKLRHIVALYDEGLEVSKYVLVNESEYTFTFMNKETKKLVYIRY